MFKKFRLSSFGGGVLAGGIVLCMGNIQMVLNGNDASGMFIGIIFIVIGSALFLYAKNKDKQGK